MVHAGRTDQFASFVPFLQAYFAEIRYVVRVGAVFAGSQDDQVEFGALTDFFQKRRDGAESLVIGVGE